MTDRNFPAPPSSRVRALLSYQYQSFGKRDTAFLVYIGDLRVTETIRRDVQTVGRSDETELSGHFHRTSAKRIDNIASTALLSYTRRPVGRASPEKENSDVHVETSQTSLTSSPLV